MDGENAGEVSLIYTISALLLFSAKPRSEQRSHTGLSTDPTFAALAAEGEGGNGELDVTREVTFISNGYVPLCNT